MPDRLHGVKWKLIFPLLLLAALPVMAYASPPDPSWIGGMYDDADFDDVVVLVTSGTAIPVLALLAMLLPLLAAGTRLVRRDGNPAPAWAPLLLGPRAPPTR